jgi:hypothetical protein
MHLRFKCKFFVTFLNKHFTVDIAFLAVYNVTYAKYPSSNLGEHVQVECQYVIMTLK